MANITKETTLRDYVIFDQRPAFCYGGGHKFNAYPTFGRPWSSTCELLPPDVCNYAVVQAVSKPEAVKEARKRWSES